MNRLPNRRDGGQSTAEFALAAPVLILLFFGLTLSAFYAFRAAAADWGVFITGVAAGTYASPATGLARNTIVWPDIAEAIQAASLGQGQRQVRSGIRITSNREWVFGLTLVETHRASAFFRLWRFYAGPPLGSFE